MSQGIVAQLVECYVDDHTTALTIEREETTMKRFTRLHRGTIGSGISGFGIVRGLQQPVQA